MTLFDICKNVLLNNKINVSSIKHLKFGKDIIFKRFEKSVDNIFEKNLYDVCNKYDLKHNHTSEKIKLIRNNLNTFLYNFFINISNFNKNNRCINRFDINIFNNFSEKCDKLLYKKEIISTHQYEISYTNKIYISNEKIIKKYEIFEDDEYSIKKTIYFTIKSSNYIYTLCLILNESFLGGNRMDLYLKYIYSGIVDSLID